MKIGKSLTPYLYLFALASGGLFDESSYLHTKTWDELTDEQKKNIRERFERYRKERLLRSGCQEYVIDGVQIIALNKKNAERKYHNYLKSYGK